MPELFIAIYAALIDHVGQWCIALIAAWWICRVAHHWLTK